MMSYWAVNQFNIERVKKFSILVVSVVVNTENSSAIKRANDRARERDYSVGCSKSIKQSQEDAYSIYIFALKSCRFLFQRT